jgi:myo-inositol-1(or 4)-monophosphatase
MYNRYRPGSQNGNPGLNPWDTAAGVLIVEEAGGKVTRFNGSPFEINSRETVASNGLVHEALLREFEDVFAGRGLEPLPDPRCMRDERRPQRTQGTGRNASHA